MERGHIGYLDSFRAFAIIGVVLTHAVWLSNDIPVWLDNGGTSRFVIWTAAVGTNGQQKPERCRKVY